ncbi:MAG: MupG family TIM beta-alpha barrel fold protein [Acidaminococcaceae bacterium]|jgi:hypothetical protein|nr:MupG family TIM beta-alpha barrel fold protein [Acidaminococcaceae bacterium]
MRTGISLYCGLNRSASQNLALLQTAAALGISRVFTSLQIPETDTTVFRQELTELLGAARKLQLDVCADVSPATQKLMALPALTAAALQKIGITTLRGDAGFTPRELAAFSQKMRVQLNASTLTPDFLQELRSAGANFANLDALHNFYPRTHTGLSVKYFQQQTQFLHDQGVSVGAFVASRTGRRGPLFAGLPTLEKHRELTVAKAAASLARLGADSIFIGDDAPDLEELQALVAVAQKFTAKEISRAPQKMNAAPKDGAQKILTQNLTDAQKTVIQNLTGAQNLAASTTDGAVISVPVQIITRNTKLQKFLRQTFTARLDVAQDALRTQESRSLLGGLVVEPDATTALPKPAGAVTLDNKRYLRYMGELQILTGPQNPDPRTNLVAQVLPKGLPLLKKITPGRKFTFAAK